MKIGIAVGIVIAILALVAGFAPIMKVPYTEIVQYQDTEIYYEDEPYQVTETSYEDEPYEEIEIYYEDELLTYEVLRSTTSSRSYEKTERIILGDRVISEEIVEIKYPVGKVYLINRDTVPGVFKVDATFYALSITWVNFMGYTSQEFREKYDSIKGSSGFVKTYTRSAILELRQAQIDIALLEVTDINMDEDLWEWEFKVTPGIKTVEHERTVTKYRQVKTVGPITKYRQVEKERTVIKQRPETRYKRVTLIVFIIALSQANQGSLPQPTSTAPEVSPTPSPTPTPTPTPTKNNSQHNIDDDYYLSLVKTASGYAGAADGELIVLINNREAKDPTYNELIEFIKRDWTDSEIYMGSGIPGFFYGDPWDSVELDYYKDWIELGTKTPEAIFYIRYPMNHPDRKRLSMICGDFAEVLHNNAELFGIKAAWVALYFKEGPGHALNAFQTTDRGLVFIDSTGQSLEDALKISYGKPDSWDKVAYVEIGEEYGLIAIDKAKPYSYSFYEEFKQKWLECKELLSEYNEEVMRYNQEIEGKVYQEGSSELDRIRAWEARLEERSQELDKLQKELGDDWFEPLGIVEDIEIYWGNS